MTFSHESDMFQELAHFIDPYVPQSEQCCSLEAGIPCCGPAFLLSRGSSMALMDKISGDLKAAMKSGDKLRLETLRTIRAALMEKEIERRGSGKEVTPEDELGVLTGAAKKRRESIEQFQKGGRADLVDQETKELGIIQEYLPKQMSAEEVVTVVRSIIAQAGAGGPADFGKVMPLAMKELKGKADGKLIQETVRRTLGGT